MAITPWLESIEASGIGVLVRESTWGFAILVATHVLGLMLSAGIVVWFDFRLLGLAMRDVPVSRVYRRLMPLAFFGFAVVFASGTILAIGYATAAYPNTFFRLKMLALVLAGINALVYHRITERAAHEWNERSELPLPAKMAGITSLALWTVVILCGRAMSYTMF